MNDQATPWRWLGLCRHPFPPTPDAAAYFMTPHLLVEYEELRHCLLARKGIVLVSGEVGLGKTTLVRRLLADLDQAGAVSALIFNTFLQEHALLDAVARDFGVEPASDLEGTLQRLNAFLLDVYRQGRPAVVIVDDAQNLQPSSLELMRLLSNLETGQDKLLQIVLVGQPELISVLAQPRLRQLTSRVVKHVCLRSLAASEIGRYIQFRLDAAGASGSITLSKDAIGLLHRRTTGNVRRLHLVLDRCLYGLVSQRRRFIDADLVRCAARDLGWGAAPAPRRRRLAWAIAAGSLLAAGTATGWLAVAGDAAPHQALQTLLRSAGYGPLGSTTPQGLADVDLTSAPAPVAGDLPTESREPSAVDRQPTKGLPEPPMNSVIGRPVDVAPSLPACATDLMQQTAPGGQFVWYAVPAALAERPWNASVCRWTSQGNTYLAVIEYPDAWYASEPQPRVRRLQQRLRDLGYSEVLVDGWMGPMTERALKDFQRRQALPAHGRPDALTLYLLLEGVS